MAQAILALFFILSGFYFATTLYALPPSVFLALSGLSLLAFYIQQTNTKVPTPLSKPASQPEKAPSLSQDTPVGEIPKSILEELSASEVIMGGIGEMESKYQKELKMARNVQEGLLSFELPEIDGIHLAKSCIPAENVGGDFYTFVNKSHRESQSSSNSLPGVVEYVDNREQTLGIAIGDVAGHGIASALVMALSSGILRETGFYNPSPAETFRIANNAIHRFISNSDIAYVTAFYGVLNTVTMRFTYAKAGHVPILWVKNTGEIEELSADGIFLGMFEDETYEEKSIDLAPGDRLFFYTDGLTEAKNSAGALFGLDRLKEMIAHLQQHPIAECKQQLLSAIETFCGNEEVTDDQTVVILEINPKQ